MRCTIALVCKQAFLSLLGAAGCGGLIVQNVALMSNLAFHRGLGATSCAECSFVG